MTVTALEFKTALFTSFNTMWAGRTEIDAQNLPFNSEEAGDVWVRLILLGDAAGQTRHGSSVQPTPVTRTGLFTAAIFSRSGTDLKVAYANAEDVMAWMTKPGIAQTIFSNISSPQEGGRDGAWWAVSVSADWLYITDVPA